jgi:hypothetical protein
MMTGRGFWTGEKPREGEIINVPGLGLMRVLKVFDSHCRSVIYGEKLDVSEQKWIVKTFRIDGDGEIDSEEAAEIIQARIRFYRERLMRARVSVVGGLGFSSYTDGDSTQLIQFEQWAGETCSVSLRDFSFAAAEKMVLAIWKQIILPLFLREADPANLGWLSLGLDLNPRNITNTGNSDEGFKVTCIDLFPWKVKQQGNNGEWGHTLEYPEPIDPKIIELGKFRHYSMAGLILNFWINLTRELPQAAEFFYGLLERLIREFDIDKRYKLEETIDVYLKNRDLSSGFLDPSEIEELTYPWDMDDVFRMRMLACALACYRSGSRYLLGQVFGCTHFQDSAIKPSKLQEAKKLLLEMAAFPITTSIKTDE